jgi:hypothetical protein
MGIQKIVLATDAAVVIRASGLIWELKDLIHCNFASNVVHNPRSYNLVAHSLVVAGAGLSSGIVSVRDSIPNCTQVPEANDLASVIE